MGFFPQWEKRGWLEGGGSLGRRWCGDMMAASLPHAMVPATAILPQHMWS